MAEHGIDQALLESSAAANAIRKQQTRTKHAAEALKIQPVTRTNKSNDALHDRPTQQTSIPSRTRPQFRPVIRAESPSTPGQTSAPVNPQKNSRVPKSPPVTRPSPSKTTNPPRPSQPPKPAFTTHLRSYTPSKPSPSKPLTSSSTRTTTTTTSSPIKPTKPSLPSHTKPPHTTPPPPPTIPNLRTQSTLLNAHILHRTSSVVLSAYTSSAHRHLKDTFESLQEIYSTIILPLERSVRQQENALALDRWSGGNSVGLGRKLGVLVEVVGRLMTLTAEAGEGCVVRQPVRTGERRLDETDKAGCIDGGGDGMETAAYTKLIDQFSTWLSWVQEVWKARDRQTQSQTLGGYATLPSLNETPSATTVPTSTTINPSQFTTIDSLGDSMKAELRTIGSLLQALAARLDEAKGLPFRPTDSALGASSDGDGEVRQMKSTPELVYELTRALLAGMREEVQLMRELEAEIVLGEEMWVEQGLRDFEGTMSRVS